MKPIHLPSILIALVFSLVACSNFGEKVSISGTKAEVYYKGDGVTEAEAIKVGDFLKEVGFLSTDKAASIQLEKNGETYVVRFVYDKEYYEKTVGLESVFKMFGVKMSKELFDNKKVIIALADKYFKDYKSIPFDEATALNEKKPETGEAVTNEFDHKTIGDVTFYWKDISIQESKTISEYIAKNGAFEGGHSEIYISKDDDRVLLRFPVKEEYENDLATIKEIKKVSADIKENVFPNDPYTFQMTNEKLVAVKTFDY